MKRLALLLGLFAMLILAGNVSATVYLCDSCSNCTSKIVGASPGDSVLLTQDILDFSDSSSCIDYSAGTIDGVTFSCGGFEVNCDGSCDNPVYIGGTNNTVKDCYISLDTNVGYGVVISGATNVSLQNTVIDNALNGIASDSTSSLTIINVTMLGAEYGVYLYPDVSGATFENVFVDMPTDEDFGFFINGASDSFFKNISCSGDGVDFILNGGAVNTTIRDSNLAVIASDGFSGDTYIYNVSAGGLSLKDCSGSVIKDSIIGDSAISLFLCDDSIIDSIVTGNGAGNFALALVSSSNVTIKNSNISTSDGFTETLYIDGAGTSATFFNNIFNTSVDYIYSGSVYSFLNFNTSDSVLTNIVGGSHTGGNFWARPDGTGYSETCDNLDNDSFCDSPFAVDMSNTDFLPLSGSYSEEAPDVLDINWESPVNDSIIDANYINWSVNLSEAPVTCLLSVNGSSNVSMTIQGSRCVYVSTGLSNETTYCGVVYASDIDESNVSSVQCATAVFSLPSAPPVGAMTGLLSESGTGLGNFLDALANPLTQFLLAIGFVSGIFLVVFAFVKAIGMLGTVTGDVGGEL